MPQKPLIIAVAGNPNAGKTTIFNMLTGANQTVGNYPGVTVEKKQGTAHHGDVELRVVDLPGTYSLTAYSLEEIVARNFIVDHPLDVVLDVVDASNLERNLYLALQIAEMGVPMVLALNMNDIAEQRGIRVDPDELSRLLGIPVVPTVGHKGQGREKLLEALVRTAAEEAAPRPCAVTYPPLLEREIRALRDTIRQDTRLADRFPPRWLAVKLLEQDAEVMARLEREAHDPHALCEAALAADRRIAEAESEDAGVLVAEHRYGHAAGIMRECVTVADHGRTVTDALDTIVCNRWLGLPILAAVVFVTFKLTFLLADGWRYIPCGGAWRTPVGALDWLFQDAAPGLLAGMAAGPLRSLLVDGVLAGAGGVTAFVPFIFFMFLLLAVIEDSGYVARVAFVMDRVLRAFGLQGKSILAMIVSGGIAGGCAVPGVMATRTLREEKDRLATMMVAPFMSCGAKMPVFGMLILAFFSDHKTGLLLLLAALSWLFALLAAFVLRRTVIRGKQTPFVMELPSYHLPTPRNVVRIALDRSWMYLSKAGTVILAMSILLWAALYFPRADPEPRREANAAAGARLARAVAGHPGADFLATGELPATLRLVARCRDALDSGDVRSMERLREENGDRYVLASRLAGGATGYPADAADHALGAAFAEFTATCAQAEAEETARQLAGSFAGRIGRFLSPISRLAGFEWRDNVALLAGFSAKEMILSTMNMAYRDVAAGDAGGDGEQEIELRLARTLREQPGWGPRKAFAMLLFVMLYAPCIVTVTAIGRESGSWRWSVFSVVYSTILAFAVAVLIHQAGGLIGLGG